MVLSNNVVLYKETIGALVLASSQLGLNSGLQYRIGFCFISSPPPHPPKPA